MSECQYVRIEVCRPRNKSWQESFSRQREALEWAIKHAPAAHTALLMDTKSIMDAIKREILGEGHE